MSGFTNPYAPALAHYVNSYVWERGWSRDSALWLQLTEHTQLTNYVWTCLRDGIQLRLSDMIRVEVAHRIRAELINKEITYGK